jgi:hypothetical protein
MHDRLYQSYLQKQVLVSKVLQVAVDDIFQDAKIKIGTDTAKVFSIPFRRTVFSLMYETPNDNLLTPNLFW